MNFISTKRVPVKTTAMLSIFISFLLVCAVIFFSVADVQSDPLQAGSLRFSLAAASGRSFDNDYTVLGLGFGYFVVDGLEVGIDAEAWLGVDPEIYKVSPQVNYVLPLQSQVRPYAGAFYRRTFIEGYDDQDSAGARGGVYFVASGNMYYGVGAVYEAYLNCDESLDTSCDNFYPEVVFAFSF